MPTQFTNSSTKGTISFEGFEHEIKQYAWGDKHKYSKTNWLTLDPTAKILEIPTGSNRQECHDFVYRMYAESYINNRLSENFELKKQWEHYKADRVKITELYSSIKESDWDKAEELDEALGKKYPLAEALNKDVIKLGNIYKDTGVMAAEMGYDAINAKGHGTTDSYTVVLNRTKLIIYGGDDYEYKAKK